MVNRNLLRQYDLTEEEFQEQARPIFDRPDTGGDIDHWLVE